ncbi:MAG: glycosyltransferase family 2 protein [Holosporales bacterium]|jgi:glycosyltransferase involved in cell wall biosynthesis
MPDLIMDEYYPTPPYLPLISVCIATYNGSAYLAAQLDSVLNQTHSNIEMLIGDDGSTDGTREILEKYARRDGRIRLIFNLENLGYNRNFEALAYKASGEYIAFCDQDDVWAQDKLERLLAAIGERDVAYGSSVLIDAKGQPLGDTLLDKLALMPVQGKEQHPLLRANTVSGHAMLCRGDFVRRCLPFETRKPLQLYDYYLAVCATLQNGLVYCPDAITYHRLHGSNSQNTQPKKQRKPGWFWQRWWQRRHKARLVHEVLNQVRQRNKK